MERLSGDARDRARAGSLSFVLALTLVGVAIGLYAVLVGFEQTTAVPSEVVAVSEDGTRVTLRFSYGGCQRAGDVTVLENDDAVVLRAHVTERRPLGGQDCPAILEVAEEEVTLEAPLGDRELRTTRP